MTIISNFKTKMGIPDFGFICWARNESFLPLHSFTHVRVFYQVQGQTWMQRI